MVWLACPGIVWKTRKTNWHATCQGTLVHNHLSSLNQCRLILAKSVELTHMSWSPLKKKKSTGGEWIIERSPQILACKEKSPPPLSFCRLKLHVADLCVCVFWPVFYLSVWEQIYRWLLDKGATYTSISFGGELGILCLHLAILRRTLATLGSSSEWGCA